MRSLSRVMCAVVIAIAATLVVAAPASAHTVARALADPDAIWADTTEQRQAHADEAALLLRAEYLRLDVHWNKAEPAPGVLDEAYLTRLDDVVERAHAQGVKVMLTFIYPPEWASDRSLWDTPPATYQAGRYYAFYPPSTDHVDDFGSFAGRIATRYQGKVFAYEAWNEPNLFLFLWPQRVWQEDPQTGAEVLVANFAAQRYSLMLEACYDAVKAADPNALVVGGATAPIGNDDVFRTSPQRFARQLVNLGATQHMDAYSHHPYLPGGTKVTSPSQMPNNPSTTVTLGNLGTLLSIVPGLPFYLTEYGYNTSFSAMFGGAPLSQATQADFLKRSYSYLGRHSRVKALFWYLRQDQSPSGSANDMNGVYTGLRTVGGARKRSWYTFARGMKLTLVAPKRISGSRVRLRGLLTCASLATVDDPGGVGGASLRVQQRRNGRWVTLGSTRTTATGSYRVRVKHTATRYLRVRWQGVVVSPARRVAVR